MIRTFLALIITVIILSGMVRAVGADAPQAPNIQRAEAAVAKGDWQTATQEYSAAIAVSQPAVDSELYHQLALCFGHLGKLHDALVNFDLAIKLNPTVPVYFYDRGITNNLNGDSNHALEDFTQAITLDTEYVAAYYARGIVYGQRGEYKLAMSDFDWVVGKLPDDYRAYYWRGKIEFLQGNKTAANKEYAKAVRLAGVQLPIYSK